MGNDEVGVKRKVPTSFPPPRTGRRPLDVTAAMGPALRIGQNPLVVARDADPMSMIGGDPGRALIMGVLIHSEALTLRAGRWSF
jgi:hypothetical protein